MVPYGEANQKRQSLPTASPQSKARKNAGKKIMIKKARARHIGTMGCEIWGKGNAWGWDSPVSPPWDSRLSQVC